MTGSSNGGTIFFNALGFRETNKGAGYVSATGTDGFYWVSGALSSSAAWQLTFGSSVGIYPIVTNLRSFGFSVYSTKE